MGLIILTVLIAVPLIEIGLFIKVGGQIGMGPTILVVVFTAILGTALLRHQGLSTLNRLQNSFGGGEPPLAPVFEGFCLLIAGFLLLTPGFFTDTIGFLLFIPPLRRALYTFVGHRFIVNNGPQQPHPDFQNNQNNNIIDGEWHDVTPDHDFKKPSTIKPPPDNKIDL